jgi:hypothetical protein
MQQKKTTWKAQLTAIGTVITVLLFLPFSIAAQTDQPAVLKQQFQQYQVRSLQEKLFVHTDKTFYLAGEIIWFKIYAVDAMLNKPLDLSKVAYVEILNANGKAVLQEKIAMESAAGNGSLVIPNSITSGNYKLRAYTKWMKNFSADFFYEQSLSIVNTTKELTRPAAVVNKDYSVQFFPEGGNLVYGLRSKLAFKIVDEHGQPVDCKGVLMNDKKDTVLHFASLRSGMGNFIFTPVENETYTVVLNLANAVVTRPVAGILSRGYTMQLEEVDADHLKITVHSNIPAASVVYLFVHSRHIVKAVQQNNLVNGEAVYFIDKKILADGISHCTIFDAFQKPVCERLFFKRPVNELAIEASTAKNEYQPRKKIAVELSTSDGLTKNAVEADMSMSVFRIDSLQPLAYNDITEYLLLRSELQGLIDNPGYYFKDTSAAARQAADNLMLTQGWRRFKWDDILTGKKPFFEFLPELEGLAIEARLLNKNTGAPGANVGVSLSVPDSNFIFQPAKTNSKATVTFTAKDLYGNTDIIMQPDQKADSIYNIEMLSPYAANSSSTPLPEFSLSENLATLLNKRSIDVQAEQAFMAEHKFRSVAFAKEDSTAFYGYPDKQYYLDNYTRFVTMEEVLKEYVAGVRARKVADDFHLRVFNMEEKVFFDNEPLVLIDGLPVNDPDKIMAVDPLKIKKLEIVNRRYFLGNAVYEGIISFKTYEADLGGYALDPGAIVIDYEGLQQQREFYEPAYENDAQLQSRIPDTRNQLFWSPQVKTQIENKSHYTFWSSDLTGKFVIIIQGITKDGLSGSRVIPFEVKMP